MKKIKLIVNNDKKKRNKSFFFIKKEMKTILDFMNIQFVRVVPVFFRTAMFNLYLRHSAR